MTPSDFLMLISIVLAIVAIAAANNKKIWLYKFDKWILSIVLLIVLWINYLIFYDDFRSRGCYFPIFECNFGIKGANIAYFVSVSAIIALILYIAKCNYFPVKRHYEIIQYYKELLYSNFPLLLDYINSYHKKELERRIKTINKWAQKVDSKDIMEVIEDERKYEEMSKKKSHQRIPIANQVLNDLVLTKPFVDNSIKIAPFWYLELLSNLETTRIPNSKEMIQYYCLQLVKSNNYTFMQELHEMFNHDDKNVLEILQDTSYLKLLFSDNYFITRFGIIQAIGESALLEAKTRRSLFSIKTTSEMDYIYKSSLCYQYNMLQNLLFRYLAAQKEKNNVLKKTKEYNNFFFSHSGYLQFLYIEIQDTYVDSTSKTYAERLKIDIEEWLSNTIYYCESHFDNKVEPYDVHNMH